MTDSFERLCKRTNRVYTVFVMGSREGVGANLKTLRERFQVSVL